MLDAVTSGADHVDGVVPIASVGTGRACLSITSASSVTSADVGPFIFIATAKPAIWAGVAAPVMTCSMAHAGLAGGQLWPAVSVASTLRP